MKLSRQTGKCRTVPAAAAEPIAGYAAQAGTGQAVPFAGVTLRGIKVIAKVITSPEYVKCDHGSE
jgi:hypothetical protein